MEEEDNIIRSLKHFQMYEKLSNLRDSSVEFLSADDKQVLLLICAYIQNKPVNILSFIYFAIKNIFFEKIRLDSVVLEQNLY